MSYADGFIRYISAGGVEVVRMINHALRDQNWGTVPMIIRDETVQEGVDGFHVEYTAVCNQDAVSFRVTCSILGYSDGTVEFNYSGEATSDFLRNRIGFTVLHPIRSCAGKDVKIVNHGGEASSFVFPETISPHQPFKNILEMHWSPTPGLSASLFFSGEVFETEDQRNWTDASYKTYCTPLEIPFPVSVKKGEKISQQVIFKVFKDDKFPEKDTEDKAVTISINNSPLSIPQVGTQANGFRSEDVLEKAMAIVQPAFIRIDLSLDRLEDSDLIPLSFAKKTDTAVELALFTDQQDPLTSIKQLLPYLESVKRILLFGDSAKTTPKELLECITSLREILPGVAFYAGTDAFFAELNRERINAIRLDGISYSINPQVHAFDDQSLIETLPAQGYTVQSAKSLYPEKNIAVSPLTFHMRWNPNATDQGKHPRSPTGWSDERQFTFFGACWFLFSLKYLTEAGLASVTYFDLEGENGWVKQNEGVLEIPPMLALWNRFKSFQLLYPSSSDDPLSVDSMVLSDEHRYVLILVNWTDIEKTVSLPDGYLGAFYLKEGNDSLAELPTANDSTGTIRIPPASLLVAVKRD
ncbi:MAG: hypothetical protein GC137_07935 [Alphaproteobacteria bacterium]|nr:hypothetical protein [Alphaproteobacteria bacterium]